MMRRPRREPRATFYAIRQRDGRYVSKLGRPIEWDEKLPLTFRFKKDAQRVVKNRLASAVKTLGIKIVRL